MSESKENNTLSCAVARDLMPLYVENLTEEETTRMLRDHIASCAACAQSYGMQKTRLEIEKKPQRPDFSGVKFFKKSFLKRIALIMAVAIMSCIIVLGSYAYVFGNQLIDVDDLRVVGQYELSDGRIVIALQAAGHAVSNTVRHSNEWTDGRYYEYDEYGNRTTITDQNLRVQAHMTLAYDRFDLWIKNEDDRGHTFYYMFSPSDANQKFTSGYHMAFSTPAPKLVKSEETETESQSPQAQPQTYLSYLDVNGRTVWKAGDPLRKLSVDEEEVLLRAMEEAGFLDSAALLPKVDIIDTLMGN